MKRICVMREVSIILIILDMRQELGGPHKGRKVPIAQSAMVGNGRIYWNRFN